MNDHSNRICLSCHVRNLERSANLFGYTLRPINHVETNLPSEYHAFFGNLIVQCNLKIESRVWETFAEIDRMPYKTTLRALYEDFLVLLEVGLQPKTEEGTQRLIILMRRIKNLMNLLNSIKSD